MQLSMLLIFQVWINHESCGAKDAGLLRLSQNLIWA